MVDVRAGRDVPGEVEDFLKRAGVLVIGGEERAAASGATFETLDPATEDVLTDIPRASGEDVAAAVAAARSAHEDGRWSGLPPAQRGPPLLAGPYGPAASRPASRIARRTFLLGKPT